MPEKYIRVATGQPHDLQTWWVCKSRHNSDML